MTSDKRPDQRFAMLALELTTEVTANPGPPAAPSLMMVNGVITCPRCGTCAFTPIPDREVFCRGCPGLPCYKLPDDVGQLETSPYRCRSCSYQRPVTMTLSDVNLYCPSCSALTLHSKQVDKAKPTTDKNRTWSEFETRIPDERAENLIRPSAGIELQGVIRLSRDLRGTAGLFAAMTSILGLRDFVEYAIEKRRDNARAGIKDLDRRTGRTLRGIVDTLAKNYQEGPIEAWVIGGSAIVDQWLLGEMRYVCRALDRRTVVDVVPGSGDVRAGYRELKAPPGIALFVDHTYVELLTFKSKMTYKP